MKILYAFIFILILTSCKSDYIAPADKIRFDTSLIDDHGLEIGANNNKTIYYQFCIPDSDSLAMEVFKTEPAIDIYINQEGEVGCGENQRLCMGHTHPNGWKTRLKMLSELPYVGYIDRVSYGSK